MKNIFLTGATGVLGSQILYELLIDKLHFNKKYDISVLVRANDNFTPSQRVKQLFHKNIMPQKLWAYTKDELLNHVNVIEGSIQNFTFEPKEPVTLIHCAASVNLNNKHSTKNQIKSDNYEATVNLTKRFATWPNEQLIFVSTAYSCGVQKGKIGNDYLSLDSSKIQFRNAYEEYKHKAEKKLQSLSEQHNFKLTIARPSIICGRMVEEPHYVMNRYIVFYLLGKFFKDVSSLFANKQQQFRMRASTNVNLNIIPVDYAAKTILMLMEKPNITQLNIVNSFSFPAVKIIEKALKINGFSNYKFVSTEPENKSPIEKFFYNTVALQLMQYVKDNHHTFDTTLLRDLMQHISEPNIETHFQRLFDFAHKRDFSNQVL